MKWEDVDFAKRRISVKREVVYVSGKIVVYEEDELEEDLKSEAAQRSVPIPTELLIKNRKNSGIILSARNGYYLSDSTYRRRWDRLMEFGGFPVERKKTVVSEKGKKKKIKYILADDDKKDVEINARVLRHTYSTILAANNINKKAMQYVMGHEDYATTANIYTDVQEELLSQAQEEICRAFSRL